MNESSASNFVTHRRSLELWAMRDVAAWCNLFHRHQSTYVDPLYGEFRGRAAIQHWLVGTTEHAGNWRSRIVGTPQFNGDVAAGEAELVIPLRHGEFVLPFAWVQRYAHGSIVYRRDYYDTHGLRQRVSVPPPETLE